MRNVLLFFLIAIAGCASEPKSLPPGHAECLVCKYNADLACIDVEITPDTPTYMYQGKAYYFCSPDCRDQFAKNPQKYLIKY